MIDSTAAMIPIQRSLRAAARPTLPSHCEPKGAAESDSEKRRRGSGTFYVPQTNLRQVGEDSKHIA